MFKKREFLKSAAAAPGAVSAWVLAAVLPGIGVAPPGHWPGEPSVLALGISRDTAARLGNEYRQNAIVWIGADRIPVLIFLQ